MADKDKKPKPNSGKKTGGSKKTTDERGKRFTDDESTWRDTWKPLN